MQYFGGGFRALVLISIIIVKFSFNIMESIFFWTSYVGKDMAEVHGPKSARDVHNFISQVG